MQRIHDRGNIGKLILDVEKTPTPLVSEKQSDHLAQEMEQWSMRCSCGWVEGNAGLLRGPGQRKASRSEGLVPS